MRARVCVQAPGQGDSLALCSYLPLLAACSTLRVLSLSELELKAEHMGCLGLLAGLIHLRLSKASNVLGRTCFGRLPCGDMVCSAARQCCTQPRCCDSGNNTVIMWCRKPERAAPVHATEQATLMVCTAPEFSLMSITV